MNDSKATVFKFGKSLVNSFELSVVTQDVIVAADEIFVVVVDNIVVVFVVGTTVAYDLNLNLLLAHEEVHFNQYVPTSPNQQLLNLLRSKKGFPL
jgi:hypothetical protein